MKSPPGVVLLLLLGGLASLECPSEMDRWVRPIEKPAAGILYSGTVRDEEGAGIPGVLVRLIGIPYNYAAITNPAGRFALPELEDCQLTAFGTLRRETANYELGLEFTCDGYVCKRVSVLSIARVLDVKLSSGIPVQVRVCNSSTGASESGVEVMLRGIGSEDSAMMDGPREFSLGVSDEDGLARLRAPRPGSYVVQATSGRGGYAAYLQEEGQTVVAVTTKGMDAIPTVGTARYPQHLMVAAMDARTKELLPDARFFAVRSVTAPGKQGMIPQWYELDQAHGVMEATWGNDDGAPVFEVSAAGHYSQQVLVRGREMHVELEPFRKTLASVMAVGDQIHAGAGRVECIYRPDHLFAQQDSLDQRMILWPPRLNIAAANFDNGASVIIPWGRSSEPGLGHIPDEASITVTTDCGLERSFGAFRADSFPEGPVQLDLAPSEFRVHLVAMSASGERLPGIHVYLTASSLIPSQDLKVDPSYGKRQGREYFWSDTDENGECILKMSRPGGLYWKARRVRNPSFRAEGTAEPADLAGTEFTIIARE